MNRKLILILFLASFTVSAAALYVGTAPGVQDIGEIDPGETKEVKFYIVTNLQEEFDVNPSFSRPPVMVYTEDETNRYEFKTEEASQEDISDWVEFRDSSYTIDPTTERVISLDDGGFANTNGEVTFDLNVPEDAEPGYHAGAININPDIDTGGGGTGVTTLGLTQYMFVFRVPGVAKRDLKILDVTGLRTGEDTARIDLLVKNNGTVTTRVRRTDIQIFDRYGNVTGKVTAGGRFIEPGETEIVKTRWRGGNVEQGGFRVRGDLNYITGSSYIDRSVNLSDYVQVRSDSEDEESGVPAWLIGLLLLLLATILYYFEVDPLLIFVLLGIAGISAYVLVTDLPLYLIGILLALTTIIVYRWFV